MALCASAGTPFDHLPRVNVADFTEGTVGQPLDHYNRQEKRTFTMRYWKNDKYVEESGKGPIFLYICGEYTCSIRDDRLFPFMVGAHHKAELYALEHRFYGKSVPNYKDGGQYEDDLMQFLSSEQALSDIANFVRRINEGHREVIVVGGSYPGALSAWFKQRYPQLAVGSWASSAVVYPEEDFWRFDQTIADVSRTRSQKCTDGIKKLQDEVVSMLDFKNASNPMTFMAGIKPEGEYFESISHGDFAFFMADIFVESVQYGNATGLCNIFEKEPEASHKELGVPAYLPEIKDHAAVIGVGFDDYNRKSPNFKNLMSSAYPWTYQYCTEFGWFQTPSQKEPMRPGKLLGLDYWREMCKDVTKVPFNIEESIAEYSFDHIAGHNTVFTNGSEDPWQWATDRKPLASLQQYGATAHCEGCGHCAELYTPKEGDSNDLNRVRAEVMQHIAQFLWKPSEEPTFLTN